jgi:saccharopine dehydrogenase-like NADP-dependent oxidoreductase
MASDHGILIVGGYGEVGRRVAEDLEASYPGCVFVSGRNPARASHLRARRIDVDNPASIEPALAGIALVVACVRQREPHLLRAALRRGIAYTSIAPPWMKWPEVESLRNEAQRSGARLILAAGVEPGISSVLARLGADRLEPSRRSRPRCCSPSETRTAPIRWRTWSKSSRSRTKSSSKVRCCRRAPSDERSA